MFSVKCYCLSENFLGFASSVHLWFKTCKRAEWDDIWHCVVWFLAPRVTGVKSGCWSDKIHSSVCTGSLFFPGSPGVSSYVQWKGKLTEEPSMLRTDTQSRTERLMWEFKIITNCILIDLKGNTGALRNLQTKSAGIVRVCLCVCVQVYISWWGLKPEYTLMGTRVTVGT